MEGGRREHLRLADALDERRDLLHLRLVVRDHCDLIRRVIGRRRIWHELRRRLVRSVVDDRGERRVGVLREPRAVGVVEHPSGARHHPAVVRRRTCDPSRGAATGAGARQGELLARCRRRAAAPPLPSRSPTPVGERLVGGPSIRASGDGGDVDEPFGVPVLGGVERDLLVEAPVLGGPRTVGAGTSHRSARRARRQHRRPRTTDRLRSRSSRAPRCRRRGRHPAHPEAS